GGECRPGWLHTNVQGYQGVFFLQDAWKPIRYLTITPGAALDVAHSSDERKRTVTDFVTGTPHLSFNWDATHDGRTSIRGGFANYVDLGFLALARFESRTLFSRTCFYDADNKAYDTNCSTSGGDAGVTVGLPNGPDGGTNKLRPPRTWEYMLGAEREIVQ